MAPKVKDLEKHVARIKTIEKIYGNTEYNNINTQLKRKHCIHRQTNRTSYIHNVCFIPQHTINTHQRSCPDVF